MPPAKNSAQRLSVSLPEEQVEWLKEQKAGISGTLKALVREAMEMEKLRAAAEKIRARKKKKS
jgi:hypothetical protein